MRYNIAMELSKPQKYIARVSDSYYLTENKHFLLVKFELVQPDRFSFLAGQYVSIKVHENGERRSYSIVSTPDDNHGFEIVAEMVPKGMGSMYLAKLKPGDAIEVLAPLGRFVVNTPLNLPGRQAGQSTIKPLENKLLFVATGTGIAPVYSMINDLLINRHETRAMRLHWGMKSEQNLFWFDNFERLEEEHTNFVFDPVLSSPSEEWDLCTGHVQDCLKRDFGKEGLRDWEAYICGNPKMVEGVMELVQQLGVMPEAVHHEKFT